MVGLGREEAIDLMRSGDWFRLHAAISVIGRPDANKGKQRRSSFRANQTTSFFLVSGFGSGAYSAKLLAGTRQQFSGFSHMRQCGEDVLRMFVTGAPGVRGGGGMPHRIRTIARSPSVLRMTGAG